MNGEVPGATVFGRGRSPRMRSRAVASTAGRDGLKAALDGLYVEYNRADAIPDPIDIVRRYPGRADREVVGFCAAGLAFGRVASVLQSVERVLAVMGPSPADVRPPVRPSARRPRLRAARAPLDPRRRSRRAGAGDAPDDGRGGIDRGVLPARARHVADGRRTLDRVVLKPRARAGARRGPPAPAAACRYFFPRPSTGSACKRLNLYLRWMVRRDAVDLGTWSGVSPSQLIVPLDVHVVRLGQCLGLTRYRSPGWKMASDITASLRRLDPADPVRYDFALCHVGMRDQCGLNRPFADSRCPLRGWCRPRRRTRRASTRPSGRR